MKSLIQSTQQKGVKTIDDVPARIKDKVVQVLIDLDCGDLAGQA